ncbi:polyamine-transporting ATPase 13A3-like [Cotesia typhae]|uniref:polyamine-transporting ATPase 13A3-like n=1 Tax=Cotesia typhae TaxID=2053667 RepID=UPI003D693B72
MEIYGYRKSKFWTAITWFFILATCGFLRLIFHWMPRLMIWATHLKCPLKEAESVLIVERFQGRDAKFHIEKIKTITAAEVSKNALNSETLIDDPWTEMDIDVRADPTGVKIVTNDLKLSIHLHGGNFKQVSSVSMFICKKLVYIWDPECKKFSKLAGLDVDVPTSTLHQMPGLSFQDQFMRNSIYGNNEIKIPLKCFFHLLCLEALSPFYVFQLLSFCLWTADNYYYYALTIMIVSFIGIVMAVHQTRENQEKLNSTVNLSDVAEVLRDRRTGKTDSIPSDRLTPGDILVIPHHGCLMPCDAVLLTGSCILNESMLTGESVPVTKIPIPSSPHLIYDVKDHARHTLFCGTNVIQARYFGGERVLAVVTRTGFTTSKGGLVRSIMYPPPVDFEFEQDSYKFIGLFACIAVIGAVYTAVTKAINGIPALDIILEALDLITIMVPPALPATMTVGRMIAQKRLKNREIYCTSPRAINVSGSVDCICFDKTGTLTEDGLDMWGVVPVVGNEFGKSIRSVVALPTAELLFGMASCHEITTIDESLVGDPLDLKMFESTNWSFEEANVPDDTKFKMIHPPVVRPKDSTLLKIQNQGLQIGIVRRFPFASSLQRMSVITRTLGAKKFHFYCKGSPEIIHSLSRPESIPSDFSSVLQEYTSEGYRVIAIGHKQLNKLTYTKIQRLDREFAECDLYFLGFIVLENRLKQETAPVMKALNCASIKTVMVTGDNILTALSVARDCEMVDPSVLVITVNAIQVGQEKPRLRFTQSNHRISSSVVSHTGELNNFASGSAENHSFVNIDLSFSEDLSLPANKYVFAIDGKTWAVIKQFYPELIPKIATRGKIFARMSPDQKQQLVQELQSLGHYVAMVGDGANDCGALKAANIGISLSDTESSVASPFTSKETNISCLLSVIREGRAALVTSFGIFKFMATYSLTQFVSVMILYSMDLNLTDIEYLYIDLFVISTFAVFLPLTAAYSGPLVNKPPTTSLISMASIFSITTQMIIVTVFQYLSFWSLKLYDWYKPFNIEEIEDKDDVASFENYTIFIISSIQYIILAATFSKGHPYRKSIFTNHGLLASFILLSLFSTYLALYPAEWLVKQFELMMPPDMSFRMSLILFGAANLIVSLLVEYFVIDYLITSKFNNWCRGYGKDKKKFLALEDEMAKNTKWPPLT